MKIIKEFILNTKDVAIAGETRAFSIIADAGAVFSLEVKSSTGNFYNFFNNTFQSNKVGLENKVVTSGIFTGNIVFPKESAAREYDISLFAGEDTEHLPFEEVRFADGSLDVNSSIGSNSKLVKKLIFQTALISLTLGARSESSATPYGSSTVTGDTVSTTVGGVVTKTPFKITVALAATRAMTISRQPDVNDIACTKSITIGSSAISVPGENIYPAVTGTDTVDGTVENVTKIVMDTNVASTMVVGDKVTGLSSGDGVTVAELNPDGDNPKEFSVSANVSVDDGATLSFSNEKHRVWPVNDINGLENGYNTLVEGNATASTIADYIDSTTLRSGLEDEETIINRQINALDDAGKKATRTVNGSTKLVTNVQPGNLVFSTPQVLALASDTVKFIGRGPNTIENMSGWSVIISNLKIELTDSTFTSGTKPTTTTTGTVSNSTTIGVADREGVMQNVSTISGIGIAPGVVNPTITSSQADGAGNWTASAAQTLENGITLTIDNTSRYGIITGDIEVIEAGPAGFDVRFDLDNFTTAS